MPAMQTPRTHCHPADAIAGKPAPTKAKQPVGAGLARDAAAANSLRPHRRHRRQASSNRARASLWEPGLPAMQTPRTHGHRADAIAGKPAPTEHAPALGAGLARDAAAAHSLRPHRRHRRQASSNRPRAACRNRACPRYKRRALPEPHRRHRRQASSNRVRASCRSRACPR